MSNMTPFEIRLELLKMAKEMLEQEWHGRREIAHNNWQTACENARQRGEPLPNQPDFTGFPKEEEIISKAQTLNGFVSQIPMEKASTKK